ncbi:MAG: HlyD family type I secretion periplasmic adaptor subunit [Alphaproteobacteria bacterium]|nr:HlyD family type I secretion periplasmic adaptor subunit [Alphaproteobacteria bacterium]
MTQLDDLLERFPLPSWRPFAWIAIGLLASGVAWAAQTDLEEIVSTAGVVVPQSQVKMVQHLEGGIITAIHVREGETVKVGQPLVQLDLGSGGTNTEELRVRVDALLIKRARLTAQRDGTQLRLPEEPAQHQPHIAAAETATYDNRQRQFDSDLEVIRKQINQQEYEIAAVDARRVSVKKRLDFASQQRAMIRKLYQSGVMAKMRLLDIEREVEAIHGELLGLDAEYDKAGEALLEVQEREQQDLTHFRSHAAAELAQVELEIGRQRELLTEARAQQQRSEVVSPIDGVVKRSRFNTIGGIVRPGDSIMEIVPSEDVLVVEARLSPIDVGHVAIGQSVMVKISTFDYLRYGGLEGKIRHVAADSNADQSGHQYFKVIVETLKNQLEIDDHSYRIKPGMEALVDVKIGTRSVLSYLIKPVLKLRHEAFRER